MIARNSRANRRGAILPTVAISLVGLMGFVALAVDLGMIAVARTQCQDAADAAAMAGARTLNGDSGANNNADQAVVNTVATATANRVLTQPLSPSQVTVQIGSYTYDPVSQTFPKAPFPNLVTVAPGSSPGTNPTDNWSLVKATVNFQNNFAFAQVFGMNLFNVTTVATAAHRPRDVGIILDYSGSMRFGSLLGLPYSGTRDLTGAGDPTNSGSNNPEAIFPLFGPYSDQATAGLQNTSNLSIGGNRYGVANVSVTTADGRPPMIGDFQQDTNGTPAFASASSDGGKNYANSSPGDPYLFLNGQTSGTTYAKITKDLTGNTFDPNFESKGYRKFTNQAFQGFTQGPNFWGKTFFMWPPDPTKDWRQLYFGTANNRNLWDNGGNWKDPKNGPYTINYAAILAWIKNTGPNPFPSTLRSGRIVYYTSIPDSIDTSTFPPVDPNQRFWKDYIDFVLGLVQQSGKSWEITTGKGVGLSGYGGDFAWGTPQISSPPQGQYMDYQDNPLRPRLHFWFGPMTMIDFLGCYNLWYDVSPNCSRFCWMPGTCHESPLYACKLGIQAALGDINNNHPNDYVSLIMFSVPRDSPNNPGNRFNRVRAPLSRDYQRMKDALWYPISTIENPGTTIGPYDFDNNMEVPRAQGGTCFAMPLMLAYNQFSTNPGLLSFNPSPAPTGDAGGQGRKGAQKIIILETDGLPNTTADAAFNNNGPYNSYYGVRYNSSNPSVSDFPKVNGKGDNNPSVTNQIFDICNQICALDAAASPGFSTPRKPVLIHCIGFGPAYDAAAPGRAGALATLQQIQFIGKTQASPSDPMDINQPYKIVTGDQAQVTQDLQKAFTIILQGGVQVSLLQ